VGGDEISHDKSGIIASVIRVCVAGATGWVGRSLVQAVTSSNDMALKSAVSRSAAGKQLDEAPGVPVHATVAEALEDVDVLIDYTSHDAVRGHTRFALEHDVNVVIGTSGLTGRDYKDIDALARHHAVGVVAAGNFSLTAALMKAAALLVAPFIPQAEVIDYASSTKPDVPSGTAGELAERLAEARPPIKDRALDETAGPIEARGTTIEGVQVHSVRLPSFSVSTEVIFGLPHERLTIRHDADSFPQPYVDGTLLAVRRVVGRVGLTRGLDSLLL
jgi:4-hydroxy-tetrahydrodipicolinate reductase